VTLTLVIAGLVPAISLTALHRSLSSLLSQGRQKPSLTDAG
jgi:hypothetical protein